jgi:uncharacterized membrane protein
VTLAWALFFVAAIAISAVLFFTQSRAVWSLFVNLAIWPLLGLAFVLEYLVRTTVLKDVAHVPFTVAMRAFHEHAWSDDAGDPR